MDDLFNYENNSIFTNRNVLSPHYIPQSLPFREEEVKALEKIRVDYSRLAGLLLLAFKKSNFNPSEISRRVKDEVAKGIIFSAGRPSIPPKVSLFFLQAEKKLSEVLNRTS